MATGPTTADLLEATASQAGAPVATELRAAAKKLGVYNRAPGTKTPAQKFSMVVTKNTVQPLGASLVECLTRDVVATVLPRQAEATLFLTGLFPESPAAEALTEATTVHLPHEPETDAARWARVLDPDLPFTYWSAEVIVPGTVEGDQVNDASIHLKLRHFPGDQERSRWQVNFGVISGHTLGATADELSGLLSTTSE